MVLLCRRCVTNHHEPLDNGCVFFCCHLGTLLENWFWQNSNDVPQFWRYARYRIALRLLSLIRPPTRTMYQIRPQIVIQWTHVPFFATFLRAIRTFFVSKHIQRVFAKIAKPPKSHNRSQPLTSRALRCITNTGLAALSTLTAPTATSRPQA